MISIVEHGDNMQFMAQFPDGYFDVAIVDPPYGIGMDKQKKFTSQHTKKHNRKHHEAKGWDTIPPPREYFEELFRVSKNQIIWGGNYFTDILKPVKGWIFWYKAQNDLTMSDGEMAWTSFDTVTRQVTISRGELVKQNTFHPTEKPIKLYKWVMTKYCKPGDKILDTHLGSGSARIAAYDLGFDFYACELDPDYYCKQDARYLEHVSKNIFHIAEKHPDLKLF